jgi:hypothetical protein
MSDKNKGGFQQDFLDRLHHPFQLRLFVTAAVLLVGYVGVYMPLDSTIADTTRQLTKEQKRLALARDIEQLRAQQERFQKRIPTQIDQNEWVEYVLGGIRVLPLKLVALEARSPQDIGPFKVVVLNCEIEGGFHDMEQLIRWLEFNERLLRIDSVRMAPHRSNNGTLVMQLVILGVMG